MGNESKRGGQAPKKLRLACWGNVPELLADWVDSDAWFLWSAARRLLSTSVNPSRPVAAFLANLIWLRANIHQHTSAHGERYSNPQDDKDRPILCPRLDLISDSLPSLTSTKSTLSLNLSNLFEDGVKMILRWGFVSDLLFTNHDRRGGKIDRTHQNQWRGLRSIGGGSVSRWWIKSTSQVSGMVFCLMTLIQALELGSRRWDVKCKPRVYYGLEKMTSRTNCSSAPPMSYHLIKPWQDPTQQTKFSQDHMMYFSVRRDFEHLPSWSNVEHFVECWSISQFVRFHREEKIDRGHRRRWYEPIVRLGTCAKGLEPHLSVGVRWSNWEDRWTLDVSRDLLANLKYDWMTYKWEWEEMLSLKSDHLLLRWMNSCWWCFESMSWGEWCWRWDVRLEQEPASTSLLNRHSHRHPHRSAARPWQKSETGRGARMMSHHATVSYM